MTPGGVRNFGSTTDGTAPTGESSSPRPEGFGNGGTGDLGDVGILPEIFLTEVVERVDCTEDTEDRLLLAMEAAEEGDVLGLIRVELRLAVFIAGVITGVSRTGAIVRRDLTDVIDAGLEGVVARLLGTEGALAA